MTSEELNRAVDALAYKVIRDINEDIEKRFEKESRENERIRKEAHEERNKIGEMVLALKEEVGKRLEKEENERRTHIRSVKDEILEQVNELRRSLEDMVSATDDASYKRMSQVQGEMETRFAAMESSAKKQADEREEKIKAWIQSEIPLSFWLNRGAKKVGGAMNVIIIIICGFIVVSQLIGKEKAADLIESLISPQKAIKHMKDNHED